ncbi:hypothetical protein VNO78_23651 [Psophocarpus tetragonolobus]|uniref:Uncharacterized protein n=1 Tax=Psophocarpus tetragonolobus TaxID=3891 RepID=A0AAN9S721_PSOTE
MSVEVGARFQLGPAEDLDLGAGPRGWVQIWTPDSLHAPCGTRLCCCLGRQVEDHSDGPCGARTGATVGLLAATNWASEKRGSQQEMGLITRNHDGSGSWNDISHNGEPSENAIGDKMQDD